MRKNKRKVKKIKMRPCLRRREKSLKTKIYVLFGNKYKCCIEQSRWFY